MTALLHPPEVFEYNAPLEFISAWRAFSSGEEPLPPTNCGAERLSSQIGRISAELLEAGRTDDAARVEELCGAPAPLNLVDCVTARLETLYGLRRDFLSALSAALNHHSLLGSLDAVRQAATAYSRASVRLAGPVRFICSYYSYDRVYQNPEGLPAFVRTDISVPYIPYRCRSTRQLTVKLFPSLGLGPPTGGGIEAIRRLPSVASYIALEVISRSRDDWRDHLTDEGRELAQRVEDV